MIQIKFKDAIPISEKKMISEYLNINIVNTKFTTNIATEAENPTINNISKILACVFPQQPDGVGT